MTKHHVVSGAVLLAALLLVQGCGTDDDARDEVVPTATTAPPPTDAPSTGRIVTADGQGWPDGAYAPRRPDGARSEYFAWEDVDPTTGSFLYIDSLLTYRTWVLSEDGNVEADFQCAASGCAGRAVFGPGPDEVTVPGIGDFSGRLQIRGWDGTVRDSVDISAAFIPGTPLTAEEPLAALAWSPDGTRLAVGTEPDDGCDPSGNECDARVWIFDRDGGEPQLAHAAVSAHPEDAEHGEPPVFEDLAWSPDGRSLAVVATGPPRGPTWPTLLALRLEPGDMVRADVLHVYDDVVPAGSQLRSWQYNRFAFAWSPDGTRIAVTSEGDIGRNVGVAEISSEDGRVLARHPAHAGVRDPNGVYGLAWLPER